MEKVVNDRRRYPDIPQLSLKGMADCWVWPPCGRIHQSVFSKLWEQADSVCFLLEGHEFDDFWDHEDRQLEALYQRYPKKVLWINIDRDKKPFEYYYTQRSWIRSSKTFPKESVREFLHSFEKTIERKFYENEDQAIKDLLIFIHRESTMANVEKLQESFVDDFDFTEQYALYEKTTWRNFNFLLLEGTENCGHRLFIKRILKNLGKKDNEAPYYLDFSNKDPDVSLWHFLYQEVLNENGKKPDSIDTAFQALCNRLNQSNLYLVLQRLSSNDSDCSKMLTEFWEDLSGLAKSNSLPVNRLFLFGLNQNAEQGILGPLLSSLATDAGCSYLAFPPIQKFDNKHYMENVYLRWYNEDWLSPLQQRRLTETWPEIKKRHDCLLPVADELMRTLGFSEPSKIYDAL